MAETVAQQLPDRRARLIAAGLDLLETQGPEAVTTRRVAQAIGMSSQAVYSDFGSIGALVQGIVEAGFEALEAELGAVAATDDPIADLATLALVYLDFARRRPQLYAAMYAMTRPGGYQRTGDEMGAGTNAFLHHLSAAERGIAQGRLEGDDPMRISLALWTAVHGWVAMELAGYVGVFPGDPLENLRFTLVRSLRGHGDDPQACEASVAAAVAAYGAGRR